MMDLSFKDIIPVGTHLLIETEKMSDKSDGGILFAEQTKKQRDLSATTAKLLAVGGDAFCDFNKGVPLPEAGETVITARYCGLKVETKEGNHTICKDEDILAVLRSK